MKLPSISYERQKSIVGVLFISPWILGFLLFFAKPVIQSAVFSFQRLQITKNGLQATFINLDNYIHIFVKDPTYVRYVTTAVANVLYEVPIIILFSLFIAVLLNQKFRGRVLARAVFFMPVIISSGVVVVLLKSNIFGSALSGGQNVYMFKSSGLQDILLSTAIDPRIVSYFTDVVNKIFDITWRSGIQILMFLAGLQTIPSSFYEASNLEGATGWDSFWKITIPMISPMIILNVVYSIIDTFTQYGDTGSQTGNLVMRTIYNSAFSDFNFGYSSAQAWVYFTVIAAILAVTYMVIGKKIFYMTD